MIEARVVALDAVPAEGVLRPVNSRLMAVSAAGRAVEVKAGAGIRERLESMGDLPVGGAVVTPAGGLEADFLIHVVVQSADEPVSEAGIRNALLNGLRRATEWGMESLALPLLGTGAGNLDPDVAAEIMVLLLRKHRATHELPGEITLAVVSDYEEELVRGALERVARAEEIGRTSVGNGDGRAEPRDEPDREAPVAGEEEP